MYRCVPFQLRVSGSKDVIPHFKLQFLKCYQWDSFFKKTTHFLKDYYLLLLYKAHQLASLQVFVFFWDFFFKFSFLVYFKLIICSISIHRNIFFIEITQPDIILTSLQDHPCSLLYLGIAHLLMLLTSLLYALAMETCQINPRHSELPSRHPSGWKFDEDSEKFRILYGKLPFFLVVKEKEEENLGWGLGSPVQWSRLALPVQEAQV